MTDAYVHIIVEPGAVSNVAEGVSSLEFVTDAHRVTGDFDVIAQIGLDSKDDIADAVAGDVHSVSGVLDTVTNVAFEP